MKNIDSMFNEKVSKVEKIFEEAKIEFSIDTFLAETKFYVDFNATLLELCTIVHNCESNGIPVISGFERGDDEWNRPLITKRGCWICVEC